MLLFSKASCFGKKSLRGTGQGGRRGHRGKSGGGGGGGITGFLSPKSGNLNYVRAGISLQPEIDLSDNRDKGYKNCSNQPSCSYVCWLAILLVGWSVGRLV